MSDDIEKRAIDLIVDTYGPTEYVGGQAMPGDGPARVRAIREGRGNEYWEMRLAKKALEAHDATKAEFDAFRREVSDAIKDALPWCGVGKAISVAQRERLSRFILPEPVDELYEALKAVVELGRYDTREQTALLRHELAARGLTITQQPRAEQPRSTERMG